MAQSLALLFLAVMSACLSSSIQPTGMNSTKNVVLADAYLDRYYWNETVPDDNVGYFGGYLRKLVGSNCVLIERGTISPYYQCIGCDIRRAIGCISDLRANKSQNVDPRCTMGRLNEVYGGAACCPRFVKSPATGNNNTTITQ